jgi:uncharacterized protein
MTRGVTIAAIYRYPVKGLSAEPLPSAEIEAGGTIPFDRAYAIENGPSGFDPGAPKYFQKIAFLMLMRNERLAGLATSFDAATTTLSIRMRGKIVAAGDLSTRAGRTIIEAFFEGFAADDLRGPAKVISAPGHSFADVGDKLVSLINLESVQDLSRHVGSQVHPLRFRGNLYAGGLPAWGEFDWVGRKVKSGSVTFEVVSRIDRCAATNVNPETAERDLAIPRTLLQVYGHDDCGLYLRAVEGGEIRVGDRIEVLG